MHTIPLSELDNTGWNPPVNEVAEIEDFVPGALPGASRYRHTYPGNRHLDALLVNKQSDTLVVSLHGALDRGLFALPRFERLKSLLKFDVSSIYFSDPSLWMSDKLQLAWFTGWQGADVHSHIAEWILRAAESIGARRIIVSGSSGGGFASLQISTLIPGSIAVAFNPQTSIHGYLIGGKPGAHGAERSYMKVVHPECIDGSIWKVDFTQDWTLRLGDEVSALRRYSTPQDNYVLYCQTPTDWHHDQHFLPFMKAIHEGGNADLVRVHEYGTRVGHFPPSPGEFEQGLHSALEWAAEL